MKKFLSIFLIITTVITLSACSNDIIFSTLNKESIKPYKLTKKETQLLEYFGMEDNSQIISFNAPEEAIILKVDVYNLKNGNNWERSDVGGISIGKEREPSKKLSGTFTMLMEDNYSFDFNISCGGRASFKTKEVTNVSKCTASTRKFLTSYQKIELNKEIPIAVMVYTSGSTLHSYSLQNYFEPSNIEDFEGMDLVQVVTLTFSDEEL